MSTREAEFGAEEQLLLLERTRFLLKVAFVIYPTFWLLDYALYPAGAWTFLVLRVIATLFSGICLALTHTRFGLRLALPLSMAHLLGYTYTISIMAAYMGGFSSNYYVGTLLVHFGGALFMPWRPWQSVLYSVLQVGGYFAILLGAGYALDATAISPFAFTSGTAFLAGWASFSGMRSRERDFDQRRQLREMDRLKTQFFANISHEFRTPLTLITGPLEALLEPAQKLPAAIREKCEMMLRNARRLLRLINQLLDMSKLEAGKMRLRARRGDLVSVLNLIGASVSSLAERKRIQFALETPFETLEAYFDRDKVERILLNLVSNAFRFTGEGGKILIELAAVDEMAEIRVCDTGRGIPESELARVFDRFHQVDGSSTREHEGTGIGLALVKELVELHHGSVAVQSRLNFGTEFTVRLPLGSAHLDRSEIVEQAGDSIAPPPDVQLVYADLPRARPPEGAPEDNGAAQRILIVEDNDDMRTYIRSVLETAFAVSEAADGRQGLERAREIGPDLVVTDVMMPHMDGYQLLQALRADNATRHVPVILLTAKASEETRLAGLESGADDYLTKPFEARELLARARNLLRLKAQERELRELATSLEREVVAQATEIERTRQLARYLPPQVVQTILEEGRPVRVEQERRRLTCFRIALRGFEALERLDPEDMTALLNSYLSAMAEVAFEHGATLDRFVGDTVTGFIGAPTSEGPQADALRGVRAAVAMVERARQVCADWQDFLEDRLPRATAVVSSGHATVGNFGSASRLEYTAFGAPIAEAAALLPLLDAGDVACTQTTWALVRERLDEGLGTVSVKVEDKTVRLQRLLAPSEAVAPSGATQRDPMVLRTQQVMDPRDLVGHVIGDRYRIEKRLGAGGMAVVYHARDLKLAADVALKLVLQPQGDGPAPSLDREVKLARLITHANVARIYDLGNYEGLEFISMELVEGTSLDKRLETGPLPLEEGRDVLLQVCAGLEAAHTAKIVHRDLKPSNIMLGPNGRAVILDFGVAKWIAEREVKEGETMGPIGTPWYMSPEQFSSGMVDERADIYALGVVAFELFTGTRPFDAPSVLALAHKHLKEPPPSPLALRPDLSPRLAAVILRCLEKSPDHRFGSVAEVASLVASASPVRKVGDATENQRDRSAARLQGQPPSKQPRATSAE